MLSPAQKQYLADRLCEEVLEIIADSMNPEEVFDEETLNEWAISHNFVPQENKP